MPEERKRKIGSLVAYRKRGDEYEFFLQKRDERAKTNPGQFALFGGGIEEGETPKEGMVREITEELGYIPINYRFFSRYEIANAILNVFIEEVPHDFEAHVVVHEGEGGKFLTLAELHEIKGVSPLARIIINQISEVLGSIT